MGRDKFKYKSITGTRDILPDESFRWQYIEEVFRKIAVIYNFKEIRTPLFEQSELFARSIGEATDIVGKEMYTFKDRSGNSLTLKPEMTASVVRAYIQHEIASKQQVAKYYYLAPMFRQERPQKGRLRQFHQFGLEIIGSPNPEADAEIIYATDTFYKTLGITDSTPAINSIGCRNCRPVYRDKLKTYLSARLDKLSEESRRRFGTNPFRILDSKDERDRKQTADAPLQLDYLCKECEIHFRDFQNLLRESGIDHTVDGRIVRGLDYYSKTAFEFLSGSLGAQDALAGGGRYDFLVKELGGPPTPAAGIAGGIERLLMVMQEKNLYCGNEQQPFLFAVAADEITRKWIFSIIQKLRTQGIACEIDLTGRSLKAQMREASRRKVRYALIAGEAEQKSSSVNLKNMESGEQSNIKVDEIISTLKRLITETEYETQRGTGVQIDDSAPHR